MFPEQVLSREEQFAFIASFGEIERHGVRNGQTKRYAAAHVISNLDGDGNPVDAWGNGDTKANFRHTVGVLSANPVYDALVLCYDQNEQQPIATQGTAVDLFRDELA